MKTNAWKLIQTIIQIIYFENISNLKTLDFDPRKNI